MSDIVFRITVEGGKVILEGVKPCGQWACTEQLGRIETALQKITQQEITIMATLDELKIMGQTQIQKIDALNVALDGFRTLVDQIKVELAELKAGGLNAEAQAKVDSIAADMTSAIAKIDETYAENFPPAPEV
jgi:uncharacterized protein YPO0396